MKIIGSSKIDDYKKTVLEDSVLKAINAKPGDSVLFYKRQNDSSVCIYRAEGAQISTETDAPVRIQNENEFARLKMVLLVGAVMAVITLALVAINFDSSDAIMSIVTLLTGVLAIAAFVAAILISQKADVPYDCQSLITVGGPYSKDRVTGIARMTSDGTVISGDLYINALFGANPSSVEAYVNVQGSSDSVKAVVETVKVVPGYSVYKVRFKEEAGTPESFVVRTIYSYTGKCAVVLSSFEVPRRPPFSAPSLSCNDYRPPRTTPFLRHPVQSRNHPENA